MPRPILRREDALLTEGLRRQEAAVARTLDAIDAGIYAAIKGTPTLDPGQPHALDHMAYADGVPKPERLLALEREDPFWRTLGGSTTDPFGCGGETFRQRAIARAIRRP